MRRRPILASESEPRVIGIGTIGSVGTTRDGDIMLAISQHDNFVDEPWFTIAVDKETARAFGANLFREVRVTIELVEKP